MARDNDNRETRGAKVRYGVVGLGWFAQAAVLPGLRHARDNSELVALVSGNATKLKRLGTEYGVTQLYSYDELDARLADGVLDAVYIALPNHLHREYTERAAAAGVHVLCEKPMAVTEEDCRAMIRATEKAKVKLMIAYRLHFEEANLKAIETVNRGEIGEPRFIDSVFVSKVTDEGNIRLHATDAGGGPLFDIGVYCINAARYLFRSEPIEVVALSETSAADEARFRDTDEMTAGLLRFPDERLATFCVSFGCPDHDYYEVFGTEGSLRVEPAFGFNVTLKHYLSRESGTQKLEFPRREQVAPEILYFSRCILEDQLPEPSGEEGLADVRVIQALLRSAESGRPVKLQEFSRVYRPDPNQEIRRPRSERPQLVEVAPPAS